MNLHLTKEQARLVESAVELYSRTLKEQSKDSTESMKPLLSDALFQLELLSTWFERQREMGCQ